MNWYIKYDNRLINRARENRNNPTKAEWYIWEKLLSWKKFFWYKFSREKMLNFFIADFYCSKLKLVIEIDWSIHNLRKDYDEERSIELNKLWITVIRYSNEVVLNDINFVYNDLKEKIIENPSIPLSGEVKH